MLDHRLVTTSVGDRTSVTFLSSTALLSLNANVYGHATFYIQSTVRALTTQSTVQSNHNVENTSLHLTNVDTNRPKCSAQCL